MGTQPDTSKPTRVEARVVVYGEADRHLVRLLQEKIDELIAEFDLN